MMWLERVRAQAVGVGGEEGGIPTCHEAAERWHGMRPRVGHKARRPVHCQWAVIGFTQTNGR